MTENRDPRSQTQEVVLLRSSGQHSAALKLLASEAVQSALNPTVICIGKSLCYVQQYNFGKLLDAIISWNSGPLKRDTKELDLLILLYDFGRFHLNLALVEAVASSNKVVAQWLQDKAIEKFDEIDIYIACIDHIIQDQGRRFLSDEDEEIIDDFLSCERMEELRNFLLRTERFESLALIHFVEEQTRFATTRIQHLKESIQKIKYSKSIPDTEKKLLGDQLQLYLLQASHETTGSTTPEDIAAETYLMTSEAEEIRLWMRFLSLRRKTHWEESDISVVEQMISDFERLNERGGWLSCLFLLAEIYRSQGARDIYSSLVISQFEASHVNYQFPPLSSNKPPQIQDEFSNEIGNPTSSFDFWSKYLRILAEDMRDRQLLSLALHICQSFFKFHENCSIPQMKSLFASVVADCAEELGDMHTTVHWAQKAKEFAAETQDQNLLTRAEYEAQVTLADDAVHVMDDPHGIQQREWELAKMVDLEIFYEKAKDKGQLLYQYLYAYQLLCKEMDNEMKNKGPPVGRRWLEETTKALEQLPEMEKVVRGLQLKFSIAHAKFKFGDLKGSIELFDQIIKQTSSDKKSTILPRALFTKSRAYLQTYLNNPTEDTWNKALDDVQNCLEICENRHQQDEVACCHVILAVLWQARSKSDNDSSKNALEHITKAEHIWTKEMGRLFLPRDLNGLLSRYALRHRNEANPYSVLEMAIEICFDNGDYAGAWKWAELSKARAFAETFGNEDIPDSLSTAMENLTTEDNPSPQELYTFVHWVTSGDSIYMIISKQSDTHKMFHLDITVQEVEQWYKSLVETKDDLSDAESAEELLSELSALCQPLSDPEIAPHDELLVLCPSKVLFNIPLHAIPMGDEGEPLIAHCPIVYSYSQAILKHSLHRRRKPMPPPSNSNPVFFGNPTSDSPAGGLSVTALASHFHTNSYISTEATKARFLNLATSPTTRLLHYHGHVANSSHPLNHTLLLHGPEPLLAREVFSLDLHTNKPLIMLIGCGSGRERMETGNEPLGFVSAFLIRGAASVVATMWPIHDSLSGVKFENVFYGLNHGSVGKESDVKWDFGAGKTVDLARKLRESALDIRSKEETKAPYFWAGFVLFGDWVFAP